MLFFEQSHYKPAYGPESPKWVPLNFSPNKYCRACMTITMLLTVLHLKYVVAADPMPTNCSRQYDMHVPADIRSICGKLLQAQQLYVGPIPTKRKR